MKLQEYKKERITFAVITVLLIFIEVLIALFVDDAFIRPYFGDMLVVVVLYAFVRIFVPHGHRLLPLYIFLFAIVVEVLQYFHIVDILGLGGSRFFRTLIGGVFDWKDIGCYAVGCLAMGGYEILRWKKGEK